jgi:hypothetical protein
MGEGGPSPAALIVLGLLIVGFAVTALLRVVGPGEVVVVRRRGRPVRSRSTGALAVWPGLEQVVRLETAAQNSGPFLVTAPALDGLPVRAAVSALTTVRDPLLAAEPDALAAALDELDAVVRREVASTPAAGLAQGSAALVARVRAAAAPGFATRGLRLEDVQVDAVEVALSPALLRWAAGRPSARSAD